MPSEFEIVAPCRHQTASIASDGTIAVNIQDFAGDTYTAAIYFFPFGPGGRKDSDGRSITLTPQTGYSTTMPITTSDLGPGLNRYIEVTDNDSFDVQGFSFQAVISGSGSGSYTKGSPAMGAAAHKPGQHVPHTMTLKLDAKVTAGTCAKCADLNKPALLLHSNDTKLANCWLSRPIAFCGKGMPPGHWVLKRNSATAWTLELKQEDKTHVTYVAKVKAKDYTLPLKLERSGSGSKVCKTWPKSITITVA